MYTSLLTRMIKIRRRFEVEIYFVGMCVHVFSMLFPGSGYSGNQQKGVGIVGKPTERGRDSRETNGKGSG